MAITAAIRYTQGLNVGTPGVALVGELATTVVATNGNNSNVASWRWTMLDVPAGSSVPTGLISDGLVTTASFGPDVSGGYHLELVIIGNDGSTKTDRRVFQVPESSGRKIPPFAAAAAALNFSSSTRGWAVPMEEWLHFLDGQAPAVVSATGDLNDVVTTSSGMSSYSIRLTGAVPVLKGLASGYAGRRLFVFVSNDTTVSHQAAASSATNRIVTSSGADETLAAGSMAMFVYDDSRWRLVHSGASGASPGGSAGSVQGNDGVGGLAGYSNVLVGNGFVGIGTPNAGYGGLRLAYGAANGIYARNSTNDDAVNLIALQDGGFYDLLDDLIRIGAGGYNQFWHAGNGRMITAWAETYDFCGGTAIPQVRITAASGTKFFYPIWLYDSDRSNTFRFVTANIAADRDITVPALGANDTMVFETFPQTLTNKRILGSTGASSALGALSIDWATTNVFTKTLAAGSNTFTFANTADGQTIIVVLIGAASTVTWPTVEWTGGTPPTQTASGKDVYTFVKAGSSIIGSVVPNVS